MHAGDLLAVGLSPATETTTPILKAEADSDESPRDARLLQLMISHHISLILMLTTSYSQLWPDPGPIFGPGCAFRPKLMRSGIRSNEDS